jgi:hypothetical protein
MPTYALWLVDSAGGTTERARKLASFGQSNETVPFRILPHRWTNTGAPVEGSEGVVTSRVDGTLKGRIRADGRMDVLVEATRSTNVQGTEVSASGTGLKTIIIPAGQPVSVQLPNTSGWGDRGRFFARHTMSLVPTVPAV